MRCQEAKHDGMSEWLQDDITHMKSIDTQEYVGDNGCGHTYMVTGTIWIIITGKKS